MAGVKGRSGRPGRFKHEIESLLADNRQRACVLVSRFLKDESIPLERRVQTAAMPIMAKIMPDKQEILNLSVSLSPEQAGRLLELYDRNLLIMKELHIIRESKPETTIEIKAETVQPGAEGRDMQNQQGDNGPGSK